MYVCGRGTSTYGTILPAVYEWIKRNKPDHQLGDIYIAGTSIIGIRSLKEKNRELGKTMGLEISPKFFPFHSDNIEAYRQALDEISKPACAIVVVPDHLHCKIAGDCLNAGLHTLVVKPLTPTIRETMELITIQREKRVYGAVEFHKRFDRANLGLKEIVQNGRIGDPLYFIVEYSQRKQIPSEIFKSWVNQTNIFQYLGIHYVDIIYFVTQALPKKAMAIGQNGWLTNHGINTFDAVHGTIEWESKNGTNFYSYILTNWIDPKSTSAMSDQKIKVIGTKGRYESDQKKRGLNIVTDEGGIEEPNPDFCSTYPASAGKVSYQGYGIISIHTFLKDVMNIQKGKITIEDLETERPTFRSSMPSTAVIEAVNESLMNNGKWINVRKYLI